MLKVCDCCGKEFESMDGYFMNQHGDVYDTLDCAEQDNGPQEPIEWDDNDSETDWNIFWTQDDSDDDE